jgi:hypothetical protein
MIVAGCCTGLLATVLGYGIYMPDENPDHAIAAARALHLAMAEPRGRA